MKVMAMGRFILYIVGTVLLAIFILICCAWGVLLAIPTFIIMWLAYRSGRKYVVR
ncbi:MAG: hypothetical protein ABH884_02960 [Candidatus Komeilibacteria bacterium]